MYRGTTPTFIFTLPEDVDLTKATNVYVSFAKEQGEIMRLTGDALTVEEHEVSVFLTQKQTLALPLGAMNVQINWTYQEGEITKRACTDIKRIYLQKSLADEVLP